jgi:class 3 adenylate cyclase/HAMP domain-containing protein
VSIRRRLALGFITILTLFAVNEGIQLWSARVRVGSMETLDRALKIQAHMASVFHEVDNLHKQMSLMGQHMDSASPTSDMDDDIARVAAEVHEMATLADERERAATVALERTYATLALAWRGFFNSLGVDETKAIESQLVAEELGPSVLKTIPTMQAHQREVVQAAEKRFRDLTRLTDQISLGIFALSMFVSVGIAYLLAKYLTGALSELSLGAAMIGAMNLEHRIAVRTTDEFGTVAGAFNDMAGNLAHAQQALTAANTELTGRNVEIERERQVSQSLLLNILPEQVAAELASQGRFAPRYFEDVTILFTDFVGFTLATEKLAADELVDVLHSYFTAFDQIVSRYDLEKLKTIGDSYFCAGGLPVRTPTHPVDAVLAAFELIHEVERRTLPNGATWAVRVGLHTGPVVAGVVGIKKFAFDVWGDTVNLGSRMESGGSPNRINVSETVYRRTKDFFTFEARGKVLTKEKKELDMFLVTGIQPNLLAGTIAADALAPPAFIQRYRTYFGRDPVAFPPFLCRQTVEAP